MISHFVANSEKCRKYTVLGGSAQIITISHRGGYRNLLQYYMGAVFPIYYNITMGGGSLGTPNLYYVIYGRPLIVIRGWGWRSLWGLNFLVDQLYKWGNFGGTGEQRFIYFFYKFYWFIYLFYKRPVIARRGNQLLFCLFRPHPSINSTQQLSGIGYQTKT